MTHDSIGLGEDGPTHQPVEHIASLRAIPNLTVIRPSDILETIESWDYALRSESPTILVLTRQNLPMLREQDNLNVTKIGGHALIDFDNYKATILATGSEVEIAYEASKKLSEENINVRVVSLPSWEIFNQKTLQEQNKILGNKPLFAIEAGVINGWERYIPAENFIGMKTFGASGPYKKLYEHFGITKESLIKLIKKRIK